MAVKPMRGIFAIPPTPFTDDLDIDEGSLRRCVRFCLDAGCHGLVMPVNASEFPFLTDDERRRVVEITVREAGGTIPVAAGVTGSCGRVAAMYARQAQEAGADALIAMPPHIVKASPAEIFDYFAEIDKAATVPIFIQNYVPPVGTALGVDFMMRLVRELGHVDYIKEETVFSGHVISEVREKAAALPPGKFKGVMGGKAGRYIIDEYRRGACGNMPACEVADIQVLIWDALEAGDERRAASLFNAVLPLLNFEATYGAALYKAVLKRRGVIASAAIRQVDGRKLDRFDGIELDRIMHDVEPLFTVK